MPVSAVDSVREKSLVTSDNSTDDDNMFTMKRQKCTSNVLTAQRFNKYIAYTKTLVTVIYLHSLNLQTQCCLQTVWKQPYLNGEICHVLQEQQISQPPCVPQCSQ